MSYAPSPSTSVPSPHPDTAFTGSDLTGPTLILGGLLLLAALSFALRKLLFGEGEL